MMSCTGLKKIYIFIRTSDIILDLFFKWVIFFRLKKQIKFFVYSERIYLETFTFAIILVDIFIFLKTR